MELMESTRPETAKFTSPRDVTVVSENGGACCRFEAGQTRVIHRDLFDAAISAGVMPEESLYIPPVEVVVDKRPEEDINHEQLVEACKKLITIGNPDNFTIVGQPRAASVKKLVDFSFTTKDVERAFGEAVHEVEQDGDDSSEHIESDSGTPE